MKEYLQPKIYYNYVFNIPTVLIVPQAMFIARMHKYVRQCIYHRRPAMVRMFIGEPIEGAIFPLPN